MPEIPCCCDDDGDQLSLVHIHVLPKPKRKATPGIRYAKFKPRTRQLCADCISDIHRLGVAVAPLPRPVRWRRTDSTGSAYLCEAHKDQRQESEQ